MKTNFTDAAKKIASGAANFLKQQEVILGGAAGSVALGLLEMTNINTLDPSELNMTQLEGIGAAAGFGLVTAAYAKFKNVQDEKREKYYDENPGARERDEAAAKIRAKEHEDNNSKLNPFEPKFNPFQL